MLAVLVIVATANAVNLTDGLDGLAAGSSTFCFGVLSIIGYWQFRHFSIYHLHSALDLGLVAVALVGSMPGLPVVERGAGAHHHGRHRRAGHRHGSRARSRCS